jgi:hypothetical protein
MPAGSGKKKLALKKASLPKKAVKKPLAKASGKAKSKPVKGKAASRPAPAPKKGKRPVAVKAAKSKTAKALTKAKKTVVRSAAKAVRSVKKVAAKATKAAAKRVKAVPKGAKKAIKAAPKVAAKPVKAVIAAKVAVPKVAPPKPAARPVTAAPAAPSAGKAAPSVVAKPRRPKLRIRPDSGPLASWLPQPDAARPRPSSFIPAPPRAENPYSVAAPPATSDRIIRPDDLAGLEHAIRTSPIRVDIEQSGGRTHIYASPESLTIRAGDGIEWDFRYLGGADVIVEEVQIEFDKPSPFGKTSFRSSRPGSARPHRQISGAASKESAGRSLEYTVRCFDLVKNEVAKSKLKVSIS